MAATRGVLVTAALTMGIASFVALGAEQRPAPAAQTPANPPPAGQRGQRGQRGDAPDAAKPAGPEAKPLVPVVASTVAAHPDEYYGVHVTMTATVDKILSPTSFSMDQDRTKSTGQEVLILAPRLNEPVEVNSYVTVLGEIVKFDPADIMKKAKDLKVDLPEVPAEVAAKYTGKPALIATTVLNAKMVNLAMRLPPPMTGDEEMLDKVMKRVAPAFTALRGAVDKSDMEATKQNATILKQAFTETEAFWKSKNKPDAMKWAGDAKAQADAIERDVATGKWDTIKTSATTLGTSCGSCHGVYRERFDDGSYRIKMGPKEGK
jgi:cytochrome c556